MSFRSDAALQSEATNVDWGRSDDLSRPGFLAIAERGIGDALTLLPSLRALRARRPDLRIELLTPGLFPLAENLSDTATVLDPRPLGVLAPDRRLAWLLERNLERVWNTESEGGPWAQTLRRAGHPNWVTAPAQRTWGGRHVLRVRFEEMRALFPELDSPGDTGLPLTLAQQTHRQAFRAGVPPEELLVALQPGAGDPRRIWPAERFRTLASALAAQPGVTVVIFLSEAEAQFREPGYLPDLPNLKWVSEPLGAVVPKLAACDLCIANDSGFYHLAFNLGLSVVGIYRSVRGVQRWAYRSARSRAVCCWMPRQLHPDWARWVSVQRVLRAARRLAPNL